MGYVGLRSGDIRPLLRCCNSRQLGPPRPPLPPALPRLAWSRQWNSKAWQSRGWWEQARGCAPAIPEGFLEEARGVGGCLPGREAGDLSSGLSLSTATHRKSPRHRGCRDAQLPHLPFARLVGPEPGGPGLVTAGEMTSLGEFRRGVLSLPQLPDILTQLEGMTGVPSRMSGDQSRLPGGTGSRGWGSPQAPRESRMRPLDKY